MAKTRIFAVQTETPDGKTWTTYCVAAFTADEAIKKTRKEFSRAIGERLLSVEMLASEN